MRPAPRAGRFVLLGTSREGGMAHLVYAVAALAAAIALAATGLPQF